MKRIFTVYKAPLLVTLVLVTILGVWGMYERRQVDRYRMETLRRHTSGVFNSLKGIINSLNEHAPYNIQHLQIMLNGVLKTTGLSFVYIERNGSIIASAGTVTEPAAAAGLRGERTGNTFFLSWRPVQLKRTGSAFLSSGPDISSSEDKLVIGLSTGWKAQEHEKRMYNLALKIGGGLLIVLAISAVWTLTIHSRNLASELALERMKRAHFEELGLAAAGLAHEAKNPLGIIRGFAQRLGKNPQPDPDRIKTANHIIDAVDQTSARLGEFMEYAQFKEPETGCFNAAETLHAIRDILTPDYKRKHVRMCINAEPVTVEADEKMFRQVLVNLLLNSLHASGEEDTVRVNIHKNRSDISLAVEDEGTGIDPELLPDIHKPYVSGTEDGHGIGLAVVKRIADQHGWNLTITSHRGRGTKAEITGIKGTVQ